MRSKMMPQMLRHDGSNVEISRHMRSPADPLRAAWEMGASRETDKAANVRDGRQATFSRTGNPVSAVCEACAFFGRASNEVRYAQIGAGFIVYPRSTISDPRFLQPGNGKSGCVRCREDDRRSFRV